MDAADIVWVRNDLRLHDNLALASASQRPLVLVFTADGVDLKGMGAASRVYLHYALRSFQSDLHEHYGAKLLIFPTIHEALQLITRLVRVDRVVWNRSYEPALLQRDVAFEQTLSKLGIQASIYRGSVLVEPWEMQNKSGQPFKVFTPFYKTFLARGAPLEPVARPRRILSVMQPSWREGDVDTLQLLPKAPRWDIGMMQDWITSESGWWQHWQDFRAKQLVDYPDARDVPAEVGTSRLSTALHFGQISPRSLWADARRHPNAGTEAFLRQIVWREFAISSLYHQPTMDRLPIIEPFQRFPWANEPGHLKAWQTGRTGYPLVDAGMRELWQTGWMHNRVRMIVGSFLVKNLHINWLEGAAFFWDTLVDGDRANNSMGWQWVAGCGIDPSPYFRIFNPMLQSEKFDPEGAYIKRWVPELAEMPARWIHCPWKAPVEVRRRVSYPEPVVDFAASRQQALMFYDSIKSTRSAAIR